mmetsp:Transcript_70649/g.147137  ORF Transcript_70649/g.147137 Transcript_70649/m.147137 type:complete len:428 (+) Transcript_70649:2173-3456(+)
MQVRAQTRGRTRMSSNPLRPRRKRPTGAEGAGEADRMGQHSHSRVATSVGGEANTPKRSQTGSEPEQVQSIWFRSKLIRIGPEARGAVTRSDTAAGREAISAVLDSSSTHDTAKQTGAAGSGLSPAIMCQPPSTQERSLWQSKTGVVSAEAHSHLDRQLAILSLSSVDNPVSGPDSLWNALDMIELSSMQSPPTSAAEWRESLGAALAETLQLSVEAAARLEQWLAAHDMTAEAALYQLADIIPASLMVFIPTESVILDFCEVYCPAADTDTAILLKLTNNEGDGRLNRFQLLLPTGHQLHPEVRQTLHGLQEFAQQQSPWHQQSCDVPWLQTRVQPQIDGRSGVSAEQQSSSANLDGQKRQQQQHQQQQHQPRQQQQQQLPQMQPPKQHPQYYMQQQQQQQGIPQRVTPQYQPAPPVVYGGYQQGW